ncbi:unnamed protein product [Calypogeia fissa]
MHGKADSVELTDDIWDKFHALKDTLSGYEARDVFNVDETGLFYKLQPNKTLRDSAVKGQKKDKTQITVGLCANMDGSIKAPPLIIHKSKNPRTFASRRIKRPNNLGITWYSNKKAWMTGEVFQDWMLRFEGYVKALGRTKVALIVDNAPGHLIAPIADKLIVTKLFFLPPNTTSRFQPMDAGIIQSFKMQFCRLVIRKQLADFENQKPFTMDVYHVVLLVVQAWSESVTVSTIQNCWKHCDLVPHNYDRPGRVR